jgi:hypothetical protein
MTVPNAVVALVSAQRLQAVPPDIVAARARLARADQKLAARHLARIDIEVAYLTAYDATRIAVRHRRGHARRHAVRVRGFEGTTGRPGRSIYGILQVITPYTEATMLGFRIWKARSPGLCEDRA